MSKPSILIAEDNPDLQYMLRVLLESEGFAVMTADDGGKAIDFLAQFRPDLILTDLNMPSVSGLQLIEHVKTNTILADIPIVAMSAYSSGPLVEAERAGAAATLRKPLEFDRVVNTINEMLPH